MRRFLMAAFPVLVMAVMGCGKRSPGAATVSVEQFEAEEREVSIVEKQHEKMLPKAVYIPREEAIVNDAERAHEAALRQSARDEEAAARRR